MLKHDKWNASAYALASEMQFRQAKEAILRLNLKGDETILDIGCGDGKISAYLAEQVPQGRVHGVDLTPAMIEFAQQQFSERTNLSFEVMSADALRFSDAFDRVVSFSCLHWVADQKAVWAGIHQALRPGGFAVIGFQGNHEDFWDALHLVMSQPQWKTQFADFQDPYHHFTLTEMRTFIEAASFYIPRMDEIWQVEPFETRATLIEFLFNWVPEFRHLPEAPARLFAAEVIDHFLTLVEPEIKEHAGIRIKRYIITAEK